MKKALPILALVAATLAVPVAASPAAAATSDFRGVNWADQRDNFVDDTLVLGGLSTSDSYATTQAKANGILTGFQNNLGANTNEEIVAGIWCEVLKLPSVGRTSNFFNLGSSVAGLMAREDVRAAAMLATLPEVDERRIAAVGFSMGGYRAWQVAALSDHIAATVSACWMTGLKEMMVPGNNTLRGQSAFFMLHPGLYRYLDIPDVASIAAPRPMMVFDGETDPLFTPAGVATAYAKMHKVWASQSARNRLSTKVWPGLGHVFVEEMQDEAFAWLDHWLRRD